MLSTRSMSQTFRNWCDQKNLTGVLNKYLGADGTIKQQYVAADNGVEHDHKQAMALHNWHRGNHVVLTNHQMTMRVWHRVAVDKRVLPILSIVRGGDNDHWSQFWQEPLNNPMFAYSAH
eukprot:296923-Amphidinium_carterae.7